MIPFSTSPWDVHSDDFPYVIKDSEFGIVEARLAHDSFGIRVIDGSEGLSEVTSQLKDGLGAPEWTGDSWDAIWDVMDDIRDSCTNPLAVVIRGIDRAMAREPSEALHNSMMLAQFCGELIGEGVPVIPIFTLVNR